MRYDRAYRNKNLRGSRPVGTKHRRLVASFVITTSRPDKQKTHRQERTASLEPKIQSLEVCVHPDGINPASAHSPAYLVVKTVRDRHCIEEMLQATVDRRIVGTNTQNEERTNQRLEEHVQTYLCFKKVQVEFVDFGTVTKSNGLKWRSLCNIPVFGSLFF